MHILSHGRRSSSFDKVPFLFDDINMLLVVQVNVLDEVYNPNLREAIKTFSQWPTIPQVSIYALCLVPEACPSVFVLYRGSV